MAQVTAKIFSQSSYKALNKNMPCLLGCAVLSFCTWASAVGNRLGAFLKAWAHNWNPSRQQQSGPTLLYQRPTKQRY